MPDQHFKHPYDTPLSAGLRFLVELIAWIAGPWAASLWSSWLIIPVLVVLIGLPSVFSTPGDKNNIVVPVPGPVRIVIELLLFAFAAAAPWLIWPPIWASAATGIVVLAVITGAPRMLWLLRERGEQ